VVLQPSPASNEPQLNVLPVMRRTIASVIADVLPFDLVFLLEEEAEDVVELGRLPRNAIRDADVVDPAGAHIPEPVHDVRGRSASADRPSMVERGRRRRRAVRVPLRMAGVEGRPTAAERAPTVALRS
jgi:hypothetical protein